MYIVLVLYVFNKKIVVKQVSLSSLINAKERVSILETDVYTRTIIIYPFKIFFSLEQCKKYLTNLGFLTPGLG